MVKAKHDRFVAEYLKDLNATQAAIRAGYSPKTARAQGSRLLTNAAIAAQIAAGQQKRLESAELSATRVLEEYRRLAFSDLGACVDEYGGLKKLKDMTADMRAAIASVKLTRTNRIVGDGVQEDVVEVKLWDKTRALESLAKHFGLLIEKLEHSGDVTYRWASE